MIEINEGFTIDNDSKADWAVRKIAEIRAECDRMAEWHRQQVNKEKEAAEADISRLEHMLSEYFVIVPHKVTKTQESYTLPTGKLVVKKQNPEFKRDDKTVIAWLKDNGGGDFVKVSESLDWAGLKAKAGIVGASLVNEDGEIIPGIEVVEREPKFMVET